MTALFHLARYLVATCATGLALVALPCVCIVALAGILALLLIVVWMGFFLGAPLEGGALQAIVWFIVAPLSLLLSAVIAVVSVVCLAGAYIAIGVIPFSLLVEVVSWRLADRGLSLGSVLVRLVGFVAAGAALGATIGTIGLCAIRPQELLGIGVVYGGAVGTSLCTVFFFGLVLTLIVVAKEGILALLRRVSSRKKESAA